MLYLNGCMYFNCLQFNIYFPQFDQKRTKKVADSNVMFKAFNIFKSLIYSSKAI